MSYFTNVRYGRMRMVARFKTEHDDLRIRDRCVVRTDRGKEMGEVLTALQPLPDALPPESLWDVLRRASSEDLVNIERLEKENVPRAIKTAREIILKLNLSMKITDVDYVFGGERLIFYFTSETRVDFRELVRLLAHEFRTRIDLKQVGAREEARLIGDAGHCGLTLCCRSHLKELGGITMDMAKVQKHTTDPSKITGRCGKLLCCLRYEYSMYTEAREVLPARGDRIVTKKGSGIVVEQNMLLREISIVPDGGGDRILVKLDEIQGAPPPVAGCNGCSTPKVGAPPAVPAPAVPATPAVGFWMFVAKKPEVPPGSGKAVDLGGRKVAIFNVDGVFHAISNECSHQAGPLGEGKVEGFAVICPLHQWKFDVTTGKCLSVIGSSVRKYESAEVGEDLYVKI
jgi:cell fate regulator YaaT (PSP1 superfamily)/nitrite reductase/ring-hydroxylating ferredoxin subunit